MTQPPQSTETREFALAVRDALLMIVRYIERRYMSNKSTTPVVPFGAADTTKTLIE